MEKKREKLGKSLQKSIACGALGDDAHVSKSRNNERTDKLPRPR